MKKLLLLLFIIGCAPNTDTVSIVKGDKGEKGDSGLNSSFTCNAISEENGTLIECSDGTSFLVQNGKDGTDGVDGQDGTNGMDGQDGQNGTIVEVANYSLNSSCTSIANSSFFVKKNGSTRSFYTSNTCSSSTKEFEMGEGDVFSLSDTMLAVFSDFGIRVISF